LNSEFSEQTNNQAYAGGEQRRSRPSYAGGDTRHGRWSDGPCLVRGGIDTLPMSLKRGHAILECYPESLA